MARRNKPLLTQVAITRMAAEGRSLAQTDRGTLFVEHTVPGDLVDVQVTRRKGHALEGYVVTYHARSPLRIDPICAHFGVCGGCQWQSVPYAMELEMKQQQVYDQLARIGHLTLPPCNPILGAATQTYYRNKLEYTFSPRAWHDTPLAPGEQPTGPENALGFHVPRRFDRVLHIDHCYLQPEPSNALRNFLFDYAQQHHLTFYDPTTQQGFLRNLIVRTASTGQNMAIIVFHDHLPHLIEPLMAEVAHHFPSLSSLLYAVNPKVNDTLYDLSIHCFAGQQHILEQMGGLHFIVGPKSFYQTNSAQAYALYSQVKRMATQEAQGTIYDLYTGTGPIALFLAADAQAVVGLESVPEAIEDAKRNATLNHLDNATFYAGDVLDLLQDELFVRHGYPSCIVTDPPRAGMHPKVIQKLLQVAPPRIVYVSCNPATQARDLALLASRYAIREIQPVDMFPRTKHVENIACLERRD